MVKSDTDAALEAAILVLQDISECPHCEICADASKAALELIGTVTKSCHLSKNYRVRSYQTPLN